MYHVHTEMLQAELEYRAERARRGRPLAKVRQVVRIPFTQREAR